MPSNNSRARAAHRRAWPSPLACWDSEARTAAVAAEKRIRGKPGRPSRPGLVKTATALSKSRCHSLIRARHAPSTLLTVT